jgi:glutamine amidotransferase
MIAIIDYEAGNLTSVQRALNSLGQESVITGDYSEVIKAERIIFPGVGAAGKAMSDLKRLKLDQALLESYHDGKPILGICIGTQIIMGWSEENDTRCLGLIKGDVRRFPENLADREGKRLQVPHMGWNGLQLKQNHSLFEGAEHVLGETIYGRPFASVLWAKNLVAMQFHVEKSGRPGLRILSNFCTWSGSDYA